MPRETKEQRAIRWAAEEEQLRQHAEEFRKTMPKRLIDLQAAAQAVGVKTTVKLKESGPAVAFYDANSGIDEELDYFSEKWEVDHLDELLQSIKKKQDATSARRRVAEAAWAKMTGVEKDAVKEFYNSLFYGR